MEYNPYIRLTACDELKPFDCGIRDLNDFFRNDAKSYQEKLLAVTYYAATQDKTIVFFTLSNDKISATEERKGRLLFSKSFFKKIKGKFGREKHRSEYPAVKIGRLGVHKDFRKSHQHWGSLTLDFIKDWMISDNKTGCCFLTVDAYAPAVSFYIKNGFNFLGSEEKKKYEKWLSQNPDYRKQDFFDCDIPTFAMYFNLLSMY